METAESYIRTHWKDTVRFDSEDNGTLIGLPKPYTVPGISETFREMYYWDTYFTNVGLILSGEMELAKNNTENIAFLIEKYGFMPNGNRVRFLSLSQPPFFIFMVRDVFGITGDKLWLSRMYRAAVKEYDFWQTRRLTPSGLNRYRGELRDDEVDRRAARLCERTGLVCPENRDEKRKLAETYIAFCESGWDLNSRFGMAPQEYLPVDLNSLLYGMETELARFSRLLGEEDRWSEKAEKRRKLIHQYLWNEERGCYTDYCFTEERKSALVTCAAFYPLFTGTADRGKAQRVRALLPLLEQEHGLAASEDSPSLMHLQWDYPHGWACLQYIVIRGLLRYGYREDALRIAKKYCALVESNFALTGTVWEKYNVVTGRISETEGGTACRMLGWSAGVYLYAKSLSDGNASDEIFDISILHEGGWK